MKINRIDSAPPTFPSGTAAEAVMSVEPPQDRVSLKEVAAVGASVDAGVTMAASERSERLHHLTQAVRAGTYRPNASQLAEQILAEAELDARLARVI